MQPILTKKILKLIRTQHLRTMTVDIFDTILLNDYWPESLRYYDLAKRWVADLYQITALQITSYELLELHRQAERELQKAGRPLQIDLLLDCVLDLLCAKYDITLSSDDRLQILATMIATEIQFKITNTRPNHNLIAQLQSIKQACPDLKIYFLTDTPFFAEQIKTILQILDIKIFDGGVSSSDLGCEKQNGAIFELLSGEFHGFDLSYNLHLGDHRIPDYLMPILHDSYAIHYRPARMRGLRTLVGKSAMRIIANLAKRRERVRYQRIYSQNTTANGDWEQYGAILAQYQGIWNTEIQLRSELAPEVNYLLSRQVAKYKASASTATNVINSALNREIILRAFIWLLATFETTRWNAAKLLEILVSTAGIASRKQLYELCFSPKHPISELALRSMNNAEFYQEFLMEIKTADLELTETLRVSYEQMAQLLPQDDKKICIVEQSDDGAAMLFREFARLHGVENEIGEWILDVDGSVTKAEQVLQSKLNSRRLARVEQGYQNGPALLRQTELSADEYRKIILKPQLKKVVKNLA